MRSATWIASGGSSARPVAASTAKTNPIHFEEIRAGIRGLILGEGIIRVAIKPALAGLCGSDHGMAAGGGVFAGMPVRRAIAAKRRAAFLAGAKMDPVGTDPDAFRAFQFFRMSNAAKGGDVRTAFVRH